MAFAAVVVQLMTAGGAGAQGERATERQEAGDVGKELSSLKNELSSLSAEFNAAKERRRLEAERKKREEEEWHHGPKAPTAPRATPPTGGAGTPAR
ncbi:hypothetical protein HG543_37670 [Pyxidicoccus fallax]|uniref:Uncharacterized protein n=3 Tax=Pyxidicoccus fallax TaxID=394095 RepID=A0A848LSE8_9BACT|nr:hypothetical protein [Pyxidicoccus fallax]